MPNSGYLKTVVLDTPFENKKDFDEYKKYIALRVPLFEIVFKRYQKEEEVTAMTFYCELLYDKIPGNVREVDPLNDEIRKVIFSEYDSWHFDEEGLWVTTGGKEDFTSFEGDNRFRRGDVLNIKTLMPYPKLYEFLKEDQSYHFCFLLKFDGFVHYF